MKYSITIFLLIALSITFSACQKPEPEPEPEPIRKEPVEPSPEQHHGQLKSVLGVLIIPGTPAPADPVIQGTITQLQSRRSQLSLTDNGRSAIQMATRDIEDAIRRGKEEERWTKIKALCMTYSALQPGNERYASLLEHATMMRNKPKVTVEGFLELDGELYAFLELFDPKTGETLRYRRREGEEFHDVMRVVRIIGNQQSVEVEYLPARFLWTIPGPRERSKNKK